MECQECEKRAATLHFTQIINNDKTEVHVCEVCAKEKGYMMYPEEGYSLHNLLASLFSFDASQIKGHNGASFQQKSELQCQKCELTFTEFKRIGKFGCAQCYETFSSRLDPIFRRVHSGNTKHNGKIPKRKGGNLHTKKKIEGYKLELEKLIQSEAFEEAAKVRDKIRLLNSQHQSLDFEAGEE